MHTTKIAFIAAVFVAGSSIAGELEDANKIFDLGETTYPQYFSPAGAQTVQVMGYIARHYSDTGNYLGVKDGWVYVYGTTFGGLVNVGSVSYYLELIDDTGSQPTLDLTGHWTGSGTSSIYPGCNGTLSVDLVQDGDQVTGAGVMNSTCLGTETGQISGTISDNDITFGVAFDNVSAIYYQGQISADGGTMSGTYDWPDEDDRGTWSVNRQ